MQPHLLHIKASADDATTLVQEWYGKNKPHYEDDLEIEENGWVTLPLDLGYQPIRNWYALGMRVDFLYESYSTSLLMGEIVFMSSQILVRHLLLDRGNPTEERDHGVLRAEANQRFKTWADIWGFVDDRDWVREVEPFSAVRTRPMD